MDNRLKEVLDTIHKTLRIHNYRLTEEEIERADQEILPFLEVKILPNLEEVKVHVAGGTLPIQPKILNPLVLRYYAMAQGTLELFHHLENHQFHFEKFGRGIPFYIFDKTLVSQFSEKEYFLYLERGAGAIKRFMDSIRMDDFQTRERFICDFAEMIRKDPKILDIGRPNSEDEPTYNLLTKKNLELFGKDFFPQSTHHQRVIINSMYGRFEQEEADKLKELFQKYPNYHPTLPFRADFLKYFSVDELAHMSSKDEALYSVAMRTDCVSRMKEILAIDPDFHCPDRFIRPEILRVLDNETILELTAQGKEDISNIIIPESDKVTFFPVKKIQLILFQDKLRRKVLKKTVHK